MAQILAEIADDLRISEVSDELELDERMVARFLEGVSAYLDRPFFR